MIAMTNKMAGRVVVLLLFVSAVSRAGAQECVIADTRRNLMMDVDATLNEGNSVDILQLGELTVDESDEKTALKKCIDKCCSIDDCDVATFAPFDGGFKCEQYRVKPLENAMVVEQPGMMLVVVEHLGSSESSAPAPANPAATTTTTVAAAAATTTTASAAAAAATTATTTTTTTTPDPTLPVAVKAATTTTTAAVSPTAVAGGKVTTSTTTTTTAATPAAATTTTTTTTTTSITPAIYAADTTTVAAVVSQQTPSQSPAQVPNAGSASPGIATTTVSAAAAAIPTTKAQPTGTTPGNGPVPTQQPNAAPASQATSPESQQITTTPAPVPGQGAVGNTTSGPASQAGAAPNTTASPGSELADKHGNMTATVVPLPNESTTTGMPSGEQTSTRGPTDTGEAQSVKEEVTTASGQQNVTTAPSIPRFNTTMAPEEVPPVTTTLESSVTTQSEFTGNATENVPATENLNDASNITNSELVDGNASVANTSGGPETIYHANWDDKNNGNGFTPALVTALVFGMIFLTTVLGLVGKRIHDSYQRRHYTKIDYLVDGMYN